MFTRHDQGVNILLSLIYGIVGSCWVLVVNEDCACTINFNDGQSSGTQQMKTV